MIKWYVLVVLVFAVSCTSPVREQSEGVQTEGLPVPAGAVIEPYGDDTGLSAVSVRDVSGNLTESGILANGKRQGNWAEYHANGLVKTSTSFVDDLREGLRLEMNSSGQLERRMNYHADKLHGEYKEFKYSTLKEERVYQNGKLEGTVKIYYDNGKIMEEGIYKNGTRDGVSKWFDQEGNVTIEYEYKNGQLVKK